MVPITIESNGLGVENEILKLGKGTFFTLIMLSNFRKKMEKAKTNTFCSGSKEHFIDG